MYVFLQNFIYNEYIRPYFLSHVVFVIFAKDPLQPEVSIHILCNKKLPTWLTDTIFIINFFLKSIYLKSKPTLDTSTKYTLTTTPRVTIWSTALQTPEPWPLHNNWQEHIQSTYTPAPPHPTSKERPIPTWMLSSLSSTHNTSLTNVS